MEISKKLRNQLQLFGITPETASQTRVAIFTQIHEICFHGKGGYDWNTVYNMPIWLRKFTFNKINEYYVEKNRQIEEANDGDSGKNLVDSTGKISPMNAINASKSRPTKYR